jgi:WD repeat-containing protein 1 (actin-interacting protein 1)
MAAPGAGGAYACVATVAVGSGRPEDMQNSVVWPSPGLIVSLSLDGTLNFITAGGADAGSYAVSRTLGGHQAPATVVDIDRATGRLYSGDMGGRVVMWVPRGEGAVFDATVATGDVPAKKVSALAVAGGQLAVGSWDDKLRVGDATTGALKATIALPGQPKGVAASAAAPDVRVVATGSAVVVTSGGAIAQTVDAAWGPTCVAISDDGATVAVGGTDKRVHLYKLAPGGALTAGPVTPEASAAVSVVAVSPDGSKVAMGDATREVRLYASADGSALVSGRWMAHTTRVTGLKWSPSGHLLASVSSDRRVAIWDPASDAVKKTFDLAHPQPFASVVWASDDALWTLGTDGVLVRRVLVL